MRLRALMPPPHMNGGAIKLFPEDHARRLSQPVRVR